jgi:hypothetical protein
MFPQDIALRVGVDKNRYLLRSRQHRYAWTPGGTELHGERGLKNLFEQLALVDAGRRTNAKALAALKQDDLIGVLGG